MTQSISKPTKPTALLLILQVILLTVPFFVLQTAFDFPGILRKPADVALTLLHQNRATIVPAYYVFTLSGVLLVALAVLLRDGLAHTEGKASSLLNVSAVFGVVAGIMQVLGFVRWPFMMAYLAEAYVNPATSSASREAITVVYESYNRWAGASVGEHLGFLFQGVWLVLLSLALLRSAGAFRVLGVAGVLVGLGILISIAEQFGGPPASVFAAVNVFANIGLTMWLLALGVVVWLAQPVTK